MKLQCDSLNDIDVFPINLTVRIFDITLSKCFILVDYRYLCYKSTVTWRDFLPRKMIVLHLSIIILSLFRDLMRNEKYILTVKWIINSFSIFCIASIFYIRMIVVCTTINITQDALDLIKKTVEWINMFFYTRSERREVSLYN